MTRGETPAEALLSAIEEQNDRLKEAVEGQKRVLEAFKRYEDETGKTAPGPKRSKLEIPRVKSRLSREIGRTIENAEGFYTFDPTDFTLEIEDNTRDEIPSLGWEPGDFHETIQIAANIQRINQW